MLCVDVSEPTTYKTSYCCPDSNQLPGSVAISLVLGGWVRDISSLRTV